MGTYCIYKVTNLLNGKIYIGCTKLFVNFFKKCKSAGMHTAVDTAGNVPFEYFEKIMPYTDMFLYDIKAFSDDLHIEGTGVSNKRILENLKKLSAVFKGDIMIRIPVIPGYNDSADEMKKISDFVKTLNVSLKAYCKTMEHITIA